nr:MAG: hypothetical protein DIU70_13430 [Bacillota bacterium]
MAWPFRAPVPACGPGCRLATDRLGHWMDEVMAEATRRGDFDDLPGKGKPLRLGNLTPSAAWRRRSTSTSRTRDSLRSGWNSGGRSPKGLPGSRQTPTTPTGTGGCRR